MVFGGNLADGVWVLQFVPVGVAAVGFLVAFGIEWVMVEGAGGRKAGEVRAEEEKGEVMAKEET